MFELTVSLVVVTALCLASKSLRLHAVAGVGVLSLLHPKVMLALLLIGGIGFAIFHFKPKE